MKTKTIVLFLTVTLLVACQDAEKEQLRARIRSLEDNAVLSARIQVKKERERAVQGFIFGAIVAATLVGLFISGRKGVPRENVAESIVGGSKQDHAPVAGPSSLNGLPGRPAADQTATENVVVDVNSMLVPIDRISVSRFLSLVIALDRASIETTWVYELPAYKALAMAEDGYSRVVVNALTDRKENLVLIQKGCLAMHVSRARVRTISNNPQIRATSASEQGYSKSMIEVHQVCFTGERLRCRVLPRGAAPIYDLPEAVSLLNLSAVVGSEKAVAKKEMPRRNGSANGFQSKAPATPR